MRGMMKSQALLVAALAVSGAGCAQGPQPATRAEVKQVADRPPVLAAERSTLPNVETVRPGEPVKLAPPYATPSANNGPTVVEVPDNALPQVADGYTVSVWTRDAQNPRYLTTAPNGDIFVAESRPGRIRIFRDTNGDGKPDADFTFASGLNRPFGIDFYKNWVYVANTNGLVRFPYKDGDTAATGPAESITDLPTGGHWTRGVAVDAKANKVYVSVGSHSNVDVEPAPRATVLVMNPDGSDRKVFAAGLRNPVSIRFNPQSHKLWTVVNERDGLGDNVPPDYATEVKAGAFYGWPYAYIGQNEDPRRKGERPDLVKKAVVPDVLLGPHTAALGIAFNPGPMIPGKGDAYVALHGSWNRSARDGYKVMRIPFKDGRPSGDPVTVLGGFVLDNGHVWGRPVGLTFMKDGSLLASEDGNNIIYRVTRSGGQKAAAR